MRAYVLYHIQQTLFPLMLAIIGRRSKGVLGILVNTNPWCTRFN